MSKYNQYYIFDDNVPYKGLLLHPIRIRDYMMFLYFFQCLMLEKNSIKDPVLAIKAISMTYLEYMNFISEKDELGNITVNSPMGLFVALMSIVLDRKNDKDFGINFYIGKDGRPLFEIDGIMYDSGDFDEIRNIIAEQNSLELPDEKIQKEVREEIERARKYKEKLNGSKMSSFEEQITALSLYSGWDLEKVYNMTIRKFRMSINRADHMIMSNIYLTASMSGFAEFKDKSVLKRWIADLETDNKYSDVTMSVSDLQEKIGSGGT